MMMVRFSGFLLGATFGFTVSFFSYLILISTDASPGCVSESRTLRRVVKFVPGLLESTPELREFTPEPCEPIPEPCESIPEEPLESIPEGPRESVAVLISGQCQRFIYRDQPGPLFTFSPTMPKPKVDVYIALHCGKLQTPFTGKIDSPPYIMKPLDIVDIEQWYLSKGANNVTVKVLDDGTMEKMQREITAQTTNPYGIKGGYNLSAMLGYNSLRWETEARTFYSRNFVFGMAQQVQAYTGYVFWREDNYFLSPLDLDEALFSHKNNTKDKPFIVVDKPCEFGAYSDKMYVANHLGAGLLFGSTYAEFIERMKRFVLFSYYRMQANEKENYMQPETFVQDSLSTAAVEKMYMLRVDVRYNDGVRCIPIIYHYCLPQEIKELALQHDIGACVQG